MENQNNGQLNHLRDTLLQVADRLTSLQNSQNNNSEGKVGWIFRSTKLLHAACIPVLPRCVRKKKLIQASAEAIQKYSSKALVAFRT